MSTLDIIIIDIDARIVNSDECGIFGINVQHGGSIMANKIARKVPVNKQRFLEVLKLRNCSIRKLGESYEQIERTEKTIRRCLAAGEMPPDLLDRIAKYLNVHPDYLSGVYDTAADRVEDKHFRTLFKTFIKPEKYPYLLKTKSKIEYTSYFENILTMNDVSMEQFNTLSPEERVLFRQEMDAAILGVIAKHLATDSLEKDLQEEFAYCQSLVGEYDLFSYYEYLEGIGLPDPELDEEPLDDSDCFDKEEDTIGRQ